MTNVLKKNQGREILQMNIFCLLILSTIMSANIFAQDYELVWSDEFDSTTLNLSKWECQIGNNNGWGNNERQYYRAENAVVDSGNLTIIAKKETFNGYQYTSARIRTLNKGDWKYGKFEMRAKMPYGKGIWPAYWMMPTDNVYGGWAASGEIDIMEYLGHQKNRVYGTLHYGGSWPNNRQSGTSYNLTAGNFDEDFHIYTLIWQEGKMQWLVDGHLYQTQTSWSTAGHPFPAPFDQRFHYILNLAVGGNWPGYPDTSTVFPQKYIIDYVRVYQLKPTDVQEGDKGENPTGLILNQNYPNPFNSATTINYTLTQPEYITLSLYDVLGRKIDTLIEQEQDAGSYSFSLDAGNLSSGSYIYCLNAGDSGARRKLVLIK